MKEAPAGVEAVEAGPAQGVVGCRVSGGGFLQEFVVLRIAMSGSFPRGAFGAAVWLQQLSLKVLHGGTEALSRAALRQLRGRGVAAGYPDADTD